MYIKLEISIEKINYELEEKENERERKKWIMIWVVFNNRKEYWKKWIEHVKELVSKANKVMEFVGGKRQKVGKWFQKENHGVWKYDI